MLCLGEGALDAVDAGNGLRGEVDLGRADLPDRLVRPVPAEPRRVPRSRSPAARAWASSGGSPANTADTLRIDRPWLDRPDASSVYQIGGVNWTWQSGWFRFVDQEADNTRDVELVFQPVKGDSSVNMRLYYDHADKPRTWARTHRPGRREHDRRQPEMTVDMTHRTGYAAHRQTGHRDPLAHGDRYVSVELSGVQAGEIHRVYQVTLNGVDQA